MQTFSNNSVLTLAAALGPSDTKLYPGVGLFTYKQVNHPYDHGYFQFATLTSASDANKVEVVKIVKLYHYDSFITIVRAQDGTTAKSWGIGDKLSARVNAGMLEGFVQQVVGETPAIAMGTYPHQASCPSSGQFSFDVHMRKPFRSWAIAGASVLQLREEPFDGYMNNVMALESIVTTPTMELGVVPAWMPDSFYTPGDVISPSTPNGTQYRLYSATEFDEQTGLTEPVFDAGSVSYINDDAGLPEYKRSAWVPLGNLSTGVKFGTQSSDVKFFPTEFGFISRTKTASTAPVISIGSMLGADIDDATRYANAVTLSTITGGFTRQRIAVTSDLGVDGFSIKLVTAAVGGSFRGRFYAKGMFVQVEG